MSKFKFNPDKKDEDSPFTNGQRAEIAAGAAFFADDEKQNFIEEEPTEIDQDMIVDLLSDIAHLCDREGWDFKEMLATVEIHHSAER